MGTTVTRAVESGGGAAGCVGQIQELQTGKRDILFK